MTVLFVYAQLYRATGFEKEISKQLSKKIFRQSLYNFLLQLTKAIMSTNNSREILACRRQVLSGEQESTRVGASEDDRQRERVRSRGRRQNFSEESRQVETVRARGRRESYSEERRQAERDRARMNRHRHIIARRCAMRFPAKKSLLSPTPTFHADYLPLPGKSVRTDVR